MRRQTMDLDLLAFARRAGTIENASPVRRFLAVAATLLPENCYGALRDRGHPVESKEFA
jgi:hypothetical protein